MGVLIGDFGKNKNLTFSKFGKVENFGKSDFGIFLRLEIFTRFLDAPPQLALCQHGVKRFGRFGTFLVDENEF